MKWLVGLILAMFLTVSTVEVPPVADAVTISAHRHHHHKHHHGKHKGQIKHDPLYYFFERALAARLHNPSPHANHHAKKNTRRHHAGRPQGARVHLHRKHHRRHRHATIQPNTSTQTRQTPKKCATVGPPEIRTVYKEVPRTRVERVLYGTGIIAWIAGMVTLVALVAGYITGWIRRKHNEEKFLGSLLEDKE